MQQSTVSAANHWIRMWQAWVTMYSNTKEIYMDYTILTRVGVLTRVILKTYFKPSYSRILLGWEYPISIFNISFTIAQFFSVAEDRYQVKCSTWKNSLLSNWMSKPFLLSSWIKIYKDEVLDIHYINNYARYT